jgi:hypothetical protein
VKVRVIEANKLLRKIAFELVNEDSKETKDVDEFVGF